MRIRPWRASSRSNSACSPIQKDSAAGLGKRYELSLDHGYNKGEHRLSSGIVGAWLPDRDRGEISNVLANYVSPGVSNIGLIGGLYYYDIKGDDHLPGARLGLVWQLALPQPFRIALSVQQNAIGNFNALVIRDEPTLTFSLSSGLGDLY